MSKKNELFLVITFCVILASLSVLFVLLPDREFSEQENRTLEQLPELSKDSFFAGTFGREMNLYFADQFPMRDVFVKIKSGSELGFLKGENNGVLYSYDQLAVKDFNAYRSRIHITEDTDRIYLESVGAQLASVNKLADTLDIPLVTVIPPRTVDIADNSFDYDRPDGNAVFELLKSNLSSETGYIDTQQLLCPLYENGEYVYYRTDHHWTTEGAYNVYIEIMKKLGKGGRVIDKDEFEIEYIEGFSGTTAARGNFPFYKKDTIGIWHLPDDNDYEITADEIALDGFYNRDYIDKSDKYSLFLDGTHDTTVIRKKNATEQRETLLIAKDSFANCLIPFLAREYDIIALNLATNTYISAFAANYNADAVLIVFNTENLITTGHLGNLR